jgi:hypothetical protein
VQQAFGIAAEGRQLVLQALSEGTAELLQTLLQLIGG